MSRLNLFGFFFLVGLTVPQLSSPARAQDSNYFHSIAEIERRLQHEEFEIFRIRDARFEGDFTKRALLRFANNKFIQVKWKRCARGGYATNNEPRYEIAAYRLQRLFLEPDEFVVPPTLLRAIPRAQSKKLNLDLEPTFSEASCTLVCLQYWLENVTQENVFDKKRLAGDSTYAYHFGNANILSYLIKHKDANIGNFLISTAASNPRVFAVDNSMAWSSPSSVQGTAWQRLRGVSLPASTVNRLRTITESDLQEHLGVVSQFRVEDGLLVPEPLGGNLNEKKGVRRAGGVIQLGLRKDEIRGTYKRIRKLLKRVDDGATTTF